MMKTTIYWLILATALIGSTGAAEEDLHPFGLKPLTQKDVEQLEKNCKKVVHVKQNCLARQRALTSEIGRDLLEAGGMGEEEEYVLMDISSEDAALRLNAEDNTLPERVNNALLPSFPRIDNQGSIGSCVAWGSTYYQATHELGLLNGYDNRSSFEHVLSPKWTYDILNGGVNNGLTILDASNLLAANGAPSFLEFPYDNNYTSWTVNSTHWMSAIKNRMAPYVLIPGIGGASQNLTAIKTALANGHILTIPTNFLSWNTIRVKPDPENINNAYVGDYAVNYMKGQQGAHFVTIVGYDDTLWIDVNGNGSVDSGERGAFLIANSFGRNWGNLGFIWVSYDAFLTTSAVVRGPTTQRVAFTYPFWNCISAVPIAKNYSPSLVAEFSITTARRGELWVVGGTSPTNMTAPTFSLTNYALYFNGGPLTFEGTTSTVPTTGNFVMDFTDFLNPSSMTAIRYHLTVMDSRAGNPSTINSYVLKDLVHNKEVAAARVPVTVDGGNVARLFVDYNFNAGTTPPVDTPVVTILSPSSGAVISEAITLTATATSASSITSMALTIDNTPIGNLTYADGLYSIVVNTERLSNGSHVFMLTTTNDAGKVDKTTRVFNVKNVGLPILTVTSPSKGATITGVASLSVIGTSPTPITSVTVAMDSTLLGNMTLVDGKYGFLLDTTTYENGSHLLTFTGYNSAGKLSITDVNVFITNSPSPSVTVLTPKSETVVAGIIPISVTATSTLGIRSVSLTVDSNPVGNLILSDGIYGTLIDTTRLSNGDHMLEVTATNSAGDYSQTTWFVTVSNTNIPSISVISPTGGSIITGSVPFVVSATSGASIAAVSLTVDSIPKGNLILSNGNYGITVDTTTLTNGTHTFQFTVTDTTGKVATATVSLSVNNVDTPTLTILSPADGDTVKGAVPLSVQVMGNTPIASVALTIDSTPMGNLTLANGKYGTTIDTTQLSEGDHMLKLVVTNIGGKTATSTINVNVANVDTPTMTVVSPIDNTTLSGSVPISIAVSGTTAISSVAWIVDSIPMGNLTLSGGNYVATLNTTTLSNGAHTLEFVATNVGGKSVTTTLTVNVSNVDIPVVTIQSPVNGASLSGIVGLSVKASGVSPITQVAFTVDSTPMGLMNLSQGAYTISLDTTKFSNGSHVLKFAATNSGGKVTVATITVNVSNVDSPVVTIQGITEGATLSGTQTLRVKATGTSPITQVALTVDSTPMGTMKLTQGVYAISLDTTKFSNGSHVLKFAATNSGGKVTVATVTVTIANTTASTIKVETPAEGAVLKGKVPLVVTVMGDSPITQVAFTADSTPMGTLKYANGSYGATFDTTKFSDGNHILKFAATNSGGKITVTTVSVNVSNS